jgi:hypothetical protein
MDASAVAPLIRSFRRCWFREERLSEVICAAHMPISRGKLLAYRLMYGTRAQTPGVLLQRGDRYDAVPTHTAHVLWLLHFYILGVGRRALPPGRVMDRPGGWRGGCFPGTREKYKNLLTFP